MFDTLIVVNGDIPPPIFWKDIAYRTLICTDGAAITLAEYAITPDFIIGDMDSISAAPHFSSIDEVQKHFPQTQIISISEQISTDFEKALDFAVKKGFRNVICIGALGKSADHGIHNLNQLFRYEKLLNITLLHTFEQSKQWVFVLQENTCITTQKAATISFFAFQESILNTQGLKWELQNETISAHGLSAMRNVTVEEKITLSCQGQCLCFLTCEFAPVIELTTQN